MVETKYTLEQVSESERFYSALESVSPDKRPIVAMMAESFINGMKAQAQISAQRETRPNV